MNLAPNLLALFALISALLLSSAEPLKQNSVTPVPTETKIHPRFYVNVDRNDQRSIPPSGAEEDDLTAEEEAELAEEEEDGNDLGSNEPLENYYPVSDTRGQTYLIPESVIDVLAQKQETHDTSATYLVPKGSVRLEQDEDSEYEDGDDAIVLAEGTDDDEEEVIDGNQFIAIVRQGELNGKGVRRPVRRGGSIGGYSQRRGGAQRNRRRRGGARKGLRRRATRKRIRRGGGRRGGGGRRRVGGGGGRGGMTIGKVRLRPRRRF